MFWVRVVGMGLDWREKTVSMNEVRTVEFDLELAIVIVSENRIVVDPKDSEDWGHILQDVDTETLLEEVHWRDVSAVSKSVEELFYPHIDIELEAEDDYGVSVEKRIYFREEEVDELESCLKAIKKFWNAWRQNGVTIDERFEAEDAGEDEPVELEDALKTAAANGERKTGVETDDVETSDLKVEAADKAPERPVTESETEAELERSQTAIERSRAAKKKRQEEKERKREKGKAEYERIRGKNQDSADETEEDDEEAGAEERSDESSEGSDAEQDAGEEDVETEESGEEKEEGDGDLDAVVDRFMDQD